MARQKWPEILYEDKELIAINKPAGLLTVAAGVPGAPTAWRQVTDYLQVRNKRSRAHVVHRLDRDTSGVLLFSKKEELKEALQERWNELVVCRGYTAVVEGRPEEEEGTIRTFLLENRAHVVYSAPQYRGGKEAITHYKAVRSRKGFTLVDVRIDTGRKNQIRVHMADLGCPVVGDKKYGKGADPLRRLGLHAGKLELHHPGTGEKLCFEAPLPKEFYRLFPEKNIKEEGPHENEKKTQPASPHGKVRRHSGQGT